MPIDLSLVPAKIKRLREDAGLSQSELAKMMRCTQGSLSAWEVGRSYPTLESAVALAAAFGTTVASLIGETEPFRAPPRPPTKAEMAFWLIEAIGIEGFQLDRCRAILVDKSYKL